MVEKDVHTLATFTFAQLQRDPTFRARFPKLRNVYVCVESDPMEDVQRQATQHFPDGGEIACYFPDRQRIMFVRHAGRGKFETSGEVLDSAPGQTIGMVVDMLTSEPDWTDRLTEVSTASVERRPMFG
jgi:hypothetical protein